MTKATTSIDTLTEFLNLGDTHYYIFDLSRLVRRIDNDQFAAMENGQIPFPTPMQQHAWLGIVFWHKQRKDEPYIWFARFPLDERGLINHAARQHYLQIILQALGNDITAQAAPEQEELLKQNPYIFTPPEHKRAAFHAKVGLLFDRSPSIYYEDAEAYITAQKPGKQWQELGVQGLHDVAARLTTNIRLAQQIAQNLSNWPIQFIQAFSNVLEHHELPASLTTNLNASLQKSIQQNTHELTVYLLRSLASAANTAALQSSVLRLLTGPLAEEASKDLLIILAARCWPVLENNRIRQLYMERLSESAPDLFPHLFADLVALPAQRPHLLQILRTPDQQAESVQQALQQMKQKVQEHV